jgi:hypothetical protein
MTNIAMVYITIKSDDLPMKHDDFFHSYVFGWELDMVSYNDVRSSSWARFKQVPTGGHLFSRV